jgi:multiple antibiotic resistance protein
MEVILSILLKTTIELFIIVDPLGNLPIFVGMTSNLDTLTRKRTFRTAAYIATALLFLFALAGKELLRLFNISIYSFMIAGGILLFILSMEILIRGEWTAKGLSPEDLGVVPIAFPLLVGPGAITATIVNLQLYGLIYTLSSIIIVMSVTWVVLNNSEKIYKILGRKGSAVIARIMAIFIAAIGIQMILDGLQSFL